MLENNGINKKKTQELDYVKHEKQQRHSAREKIHIRTKTTKKQVPDNTT